MKTPEDRVVVVTGGTRGLGKEIGLELGRAGAHVVLTHKWSSVAEGALVSEFVDAGLRPPIVVEADAGDADANRALMRRVREIGRPLHAVVSNVTFGRRAPELDELKRNTLDLVVQYSAWPIVDLVQSAIEVLGAPPRHLIGISGDGVDTCHDGYDLVGAAKAAMETLCRYLSVRMKPRGVRVNVVRPGYFQSASYDALFRDVPPESMRDWSAMMTSPRGVARSVRALCSGLMDSVTGHVLVVDEGWSNVGPFTCVTEGLRAFQFPDDDDAD
jgi:NAD(P)-dependent dehydrogenase (short-subunit alcohol dehydrogenase family)